MLIDILTPVKKYMCSMQIMTGIEVNSEADFPQLREYCPSAEVSMMTVTICFVIPLIEMETELI